MITSQEAIIKNIKMGKTTRYIILLLLITAMAAGLLADTFHLSLSGIVYAQETADDTVQPPQVSMNAAEELRGVWIATVDNINYPSKQGLSADALKAELDAIVQNCLEIGFNAIFFQVRPASDSLYDSAYFPNSKYVSGRQAVWNGFDSLSYLIEIAHKSGIQVHAWINPYRITTGSKEVPQHDLSALSTNNPARLNPDWTVKCSDGRLYYNPGLPQVRSLVTNGVAEIVRKYDVDGIHFDDYFYPSTASVKGADGKPDKAQFDDTATFAKYGAGFTSIEDWRRDNVNQLIKQVYNAIKALDKDCRFGISPPGIWSNKSALTPQGSETTGYDAYKQIYCDALTWVKDGYIDYLCPQIYWAFTSKAAPFDVLVKWWSAQLDGTGVDLYIGHGAYKVGGEFTDAGEITRQITYARQYMGVKGSVSYGYKAIADNILTLKDELKTYYSKPYDIKENSYDGRGLTIARPGDGMDMTTGTAYIMGSSDPAYPVLYAGQKLARTKSGYFSTYLSLNKGKNTVTLTSGGQSVSRTLYFTGKPLTPAPPYVYPKMDNYTVKVLTPSSNLIINGGESVSIRVQAPSGSTVTARLAGKTVTLAPLTYPPNQGTYMTEIYAGTVTLPSANVSDALQDMGSITVKAVRGWESFSTTGPSVNLINPQSKAYIEINKDYTPLKKTASSTFYEDYLYTSVGMRDYIVRLENGYYKLRFGGYVPASGCTLTQSPLADAKVSSVTASVAGGKTEIKIPVGENVPVNAYVNNDKFYVVLYNAAKDNVPQPVMYPNPMFSSVTGAYSTALSAHVYTFTLKNNLNWYGFTLSYDKGTITLRVNNPPSLTQGDLPLKDKTIIVDAGHGGTEAGAAGFMGYSGKAEKDLNLEIALELRKKLEALGANVVMTRTEDKNTDINYRMDFLTSTNPDLVISIHHNSMPDTADSRRVRGTVSLYCNPDGRLLAKSVSAAVADGLDRYERSYAYQALAMCRNPRFPSTLVEMSFLTSPEEYEYAMRPSTISASADALAQGILDFYKKASAFK
ncbi:MAG: family 10 glycosylhydrolase [Eubacteriales bacterium]